MKRTSYDGTLTKQYDPVPFTKADGEQGLVTGYASKFWEVDSYGECTAPGCFAKSISERGPKSDRNRILFRYEHQHTIGKHTDLSEDGVGLQIEAKVSDDGNWGTTFRNHLKDEIQYGLSIGFRRIGWRTGTPEDPFDLSRAPAWLTTQFDPASVVVLTELKLLENSGVSFPAVDSALIDSYRSDAGLADLERLLVDVRAGRISAEQRALLEQLSAILPAALAPDPSKRAPREQPDSDLDVLLLELDRVIAERSLAA